MRQTSLSAYHSLGKTKTNQRQRQVLLALEEIYPANNRQISEHSKLPINVVTPRMGELVIAGKVVEAYKDTDPITGRRTIFWRPKTVLQTQAGDWA